MLLRLHLWGKVWIYLDNDPKLDVAMLNKGFKSSSSRFWLIATLKLVTSERRRCVQSQEDVT